MTTETARRSRDPRAGVPGWLRARPGLVDTVIALALWAVCSVVFVVALVTSPGPGSTYPPPAPDREILGLIVASTLQTLPLAWRRTRPDLSFALVVAGHVLQLVSTSTPIPSNVAAMISAYAVAAHSRRRWVRLAGLGVAALGGLLATLDWDGYRDASITATIGTSLFISGLALVCWLWGDLSRKRRELVSRLREQNDALRRDRDQRARIVAQDERTRIAREMHDIVAHSLSVVVVQADGAAYSARHSGDLDQEHAERALTTIGTTAREALAETRRLVGVLRTADDEGGGPTGLEYTPTETLTDLADLVDRMAASGIDVTLDAGSDLDDVQRETGLAAYRVVQEALTNVIKHAGPAAGVRVRVRADDRLTVEVRDDGRGAAVVDDGRGHGLIGMRERAASVGGEVTAGPARGGGYLVTASLPLHPPEVS